MALRSHSRFFDWIFHFNYGSVSSRNGFCCSSPAHVTHRLIQVKLQRIQGVRSPQASLLFLPFRSVFALSGSAPPKAALFCSKNAGSSFCLFFLGGGLVVPFKSRSSVVQKRDATYLALLTLLCKPRRLSYEMS